MTHEGKSIHSADKKAMGKPVTCKPVTCKPVTCKPVTCKPITWGMHQNQTHQTALTAKSIHAQGQVRTLVASLAGLGLSAWILPTWAAEQIVITYPALQPQTISVNSLELFVSQGVINPDLAPLVSLTGPQQQNQLRAFLGERLSIPPTLVSQFAATPTGQLFFYRLGEILKPESNQNGAAALAFSAQKAATEPGGLTLINLLREYPGQTVKVDGQLGLQAISQALQSVNYRNRAIAAITEQSRTTTPVALPAAIDLRRPGNSPWQKQTLAYLNPERSPELRKLRAEIYLPQGLTAAAPVIVISHGVGSDPSTFAYLARHLASYGFVVAVPNHPGTDSTRVSQFLSGQLGYNPGRTGSDILNRPLDIKFLLDAMAQRRNSDPAWQWVDTQQVGVIGQSLGGATALAIGGARIDYARLRQECPKLARETFNLNISLPLQCSVLSAPLSLQRRANFRDPRIQAVMAVNPVMDLLFGPVGIRQIQIPTMIVASAQDLFAPPLDEQIAPFTGLTSGQKYLVVLEGGTHFSFLGQEANTVFAIPPELIGPNPALARPLLQAFSVSFLKTYVSGQRQYLPFLSQTYANAITQPPFRLDVVQSFTAEQLRQALVPYPNQTFQ